MSVTSFPSGRLLNPLAPDPAAISIVDIAHHLSGICRFNGGTKDHYSVAQHSVLVSHLCDTADAMHGLLHDASEAFLGDIVRPVKHLPTMAAARAIDAQLQALICQRFGLSATQPDSVTVADDLMLAAEAHQLLPIVPAWALRMPLPKLRKPLEPMSRDRAKAAFLLRFEQLGGRVDA